jgi:hypothetical protein
MKISTKTKNKKLTTLKEKFLELVNEVNCQCFPKIFHDASHISMKLIWAVLFVFFAGITGFLLRQNVLDYLRQDFLFYTFKQKVLG